MTHARLLRVKWAIWKDITRVSESVFPSCWRVTGPVLPTSTYDELFITYVLQHAAICKCAIVILGNTGNYCRILYSKGCYIQVSVFNAALYWYIGYEDGKHRICFMATSIKATVSAHTVNPRIYELKLSGFSERHVSLFYNHAYVCTKMAI